MAILLLNRQWIKANPLFALGIGIASALVIGYILRSWILKK